jgi:hypothetical protein
MSRRESVGRLNTRTQSASGPATMKTVTVAVLPPRLPAGMGLPTGLGMADAFSWDESINWSHNKPLPKEGEPERKKSFLKKIGLTTERQKANPDTPPFMMREVPYETWRKHYAKDKEGNYRGTHAPAEDCLLKPDDVRKWNAGEAKTYADKWTRGKDALPVYSEVREHGMVPEYEIDYDGPPRDGGPPGDEPIVTTEEDDLATHLERRDTAARERGEQVAALETHERQNAQSQGQAQPPARQGSGQTYDGKTTEQIIAEAQAKGNPKLGWRQRIKKGAEMASFAG